MNKLLPILALLCFGLAQEYEDVIYLKDGSVIYGIIIETKPGEYYKIKSGKNIFVYDIEEVDIIKKEIKEENSVDRSWPARPGSTWLKSSIMNADSDINDYYDSSLVLGYTYLFNNGWELSLDYWFDYYGLDEFNPTDLGLMYCNNNWKYGLRITDLFDTEDIDNTGTHIVLGYYSNDLTWFSLDHNLSYDDTLFDSPFTAFIGGDTAFEFGRLWPINSTTMIGLSYSAGFDDLDKGFIGLSFGYYSF